MTEQMEATSPSRSGYTMPVFAERFIPREQGRIYTRAYAGARSAFAPMHRFPDNLHIWDELRPLPVDAGRRIMNFGFLGFGASGKPNEMYEHGVAKAVTAALGRPIHREAISIEVLRRRDTDFKLPEQTVQHLYAVELDFQDGLFGGINDVTQEVTGFPSKTVEVFVRLHEGEFSASVPD